MADVIPLKLVNAGSGVGTLAEMGPGDTVPVSQLAKALGIVLAALVAGSNTPIAATDTIQTALQNLQAQVSATATGKGYIDGLVPVGVGGTTLGVTAGEAYIPGLGGNLVVPSPITLTGLTGLTANTWYYVYLYSNSGTPALEFVTTAPAAPYSGTARTKTGDTSRRFMFAALVGTGGGIVSVQPDSAGFMNFVAPTNGPPWTVISAAANTTETIVSVAAVVPPTTQTAKAICINGGTVPLIQIGYAGAPGCLLASMAPATRIVIILPLDATQRMSFFNTASAGSFTVFITAYGNDR
jgi:hypothetical protein